MQARKNLKLSVNTKAAEEIQFHLMNIEDEEHWGLSACNTRSSGVSAESGVSADSTTGKAISMSDLGSLLDNALGTSESTYRLELIPVE